MDYSGVPPIPIPHGCSLDKGSEKMVQHDKGLLDPHEMLGRLPQHPKGALFLQESSDEAISFESSSRALPEKGVVQCGTSLVSCKHSTKTL